ncbi:MAG TPA: DotU family type IV/VI secretion system protein [Gemmatimonadaceae bacterium]|nr:DotU family type IV/VI secretion system protein [Gemmatimonadaceae bacterium]
MTSAAPGASRAPTAELDRRHGQLALLLQELLTAVVRLRANRQTAPDAEVFRAHVRHMLGGAEQDAQRAGYAPEDVRLALYAAVAFLDESVLNSPLPMFADWPRKPLQDELFGGGHRGGELFYQYLTHLMSRQDSEHLADILEVYLLCMLLGFHGRYSAGEDGERQLLMSRVAERIDRVRGGAGALPSSWRRTDTSIGALPPDPWVRRMIIAAGGTFALTVVLWLIFTLALGGGANELRTLDPTPAQASR